MLQLWRVFAVVSILGLGLIPLGAPIQAQTKYVEHRMIHVNPMGPRPESITAKAGMPVVWQSHVATAPDEAVTINFLKGEVVAQATQRVAGMNGFELEGEHFVARMAGNGGAVALKFTAPGEYTYILGHGDGLTGTITVKP